MPQRVHLVLEDDVGIDDTKQLLAEEGGLPDRVGIAGYRGDPLLLLLAPPAREQRGGAIRRAVGARAGLNHTPDDGRTTSSVESLSKMQRMPRRRIAEAEPRPVDAHRTVVHGEQAQPFCQPMRVLHARHHVDVRETAQLAEYEIPVFFNKPPHQPHLENFFNTIRGTAKLNCPADEAFTSEYSIHKANEAVAAQTRIAITAEEVRA